MDELSRKAGEKAVECRIEQRAFDTWLATLRPVNFLFVGVGGVLALVAGASILTDSGILSTTTAGILAVAAGVLTGFHRLLGCDAHQEECRRLRGQYAGLKVKFDGVQALADDDERRLRFQELIQALSAVEEGAKVAPARWCRARAERAERAEAGERVPPPATPPEREYAELRLAEEPEDPQEPGRVE